MSCLYWNCKISCQRSAHTSLSVQSRCLHSNVCHSVAPQCESTFSSAQPKARNDTVEVYHSGTTKTITYICSQTPLSPVEIFLMEKSDDARLHVSFVTQEDGSRELSPSNHPFSQSHCCCGIFWHCPTLTLTQCLCSHVYLDCTITLTSMWRRYISLQSIITPSSILRVLCLPK